MQIVTVTSGPDPVSHVPQDAQKGQIVAITQVAMPPASPLLASMSVRKVVSSPFPY